MYTDEDPLLLPSEVFFSFPDGQCLIAHMQLSNTATRIRVTNSKEKITIAVPAEYERDDLPKILQVSSYYLDGVHFSINRLNKKDLPTELPIPIEKQTYQVFSCQSLEASYNASTHARMGDYAQIDGQRLAWLEFEDAHMPKLILYGSLNPNHLGELLKRWAMWKANKLLPIFCRRLAKRMHVSVAKIQVRNQKTLWGSCSYQPISHSYNISLNWRAVLFPKSLVTQLCRHELCHIKHMNHSRAFHAAMEKFNINSELLEDAMRMIVYDLPWWCQL